MAQNLEYASDVPGEQAYDPEDATDEAIAWRLMQEEQQQFNQRLMAMAGESAVHAQAKKGLSAFVNFIYSLLYLSTDNCLFVSG
mmetsp:Transcript_13036/g.36669  ORF Transcript_13036/g.36669 Transcript_13036/m.36669 type:complete len:84 (+) Transcript_13036:651-902(+)